MKRISWGIIGAGTIAHTFAKDIAFISNAELKAIASRSIDSAKQFAHEYEIPSAYGSYAELYADPNIDAIYIATPHNFHLQQTLNAFAVNKSVLCEKPITINADECSELIKAASESPCSVMEALWTYFLPAIHKVQEWVAQGRIGKLQHIKADFGFCKEYRPLERLYNPKLAGGCLLDMGIYPLALMNLFQQNPSSVTELDVSATFADSGVENTVKADFKFNHLSNNLTASLYTSYTQNLANTAYLVGETGTIRIPNFWSARECFLLRDDESVIEDHFNDERLGSGFEFQIQSFSQNILNGEKESAIMPLEKSLQLQNWMDLVRSKFQKT